MRRILALMRAAFLSAASYRVGMVFSVVSLLISPLPLFYASKPIQQIAAQSAGIQEQGGDYFTFVIIGMAATIVLTAALQAVPSSLAGTIGNGTLEAQMVTKSPLPQIVIGMSGYALIWSGLRATFLVAAAAVFFGLTLSVGAVPVVLGILTLMAVAYFAIGLIAGALIMAFRSAGPLVTAVTVVSGMFGGVYFAASSLPGWLQNISTVIPLTYALKSSRMLLAGNEFSVVQDDVTVLAGMTVVLVGFAMTTFVIALRYARKAGTLSQY